MLFVSLVFYLLMTAMTTYAIEQFNASQSQAGLASGIFVIGGLGFLTYQTLFSRLTSKRSAVRICLTSPVNSRLRGFAASTAELFLSRTATQF